MVDVTADDGSRRRLPQWMLGVSAAGQVKKSGDANENETLGENSNVLVKCDAKRRKRKSTEQDPEYEGEVKETVPEKKPNGRGRRKVQEPAASERQKSKGPGKGMQLRENESLEENSDFPAKCETKRRKSKSKDQDAEGDDNVPETFPEKKSNGRGRRKVQESVALIRRKAKGSSCGGDVEQEDQISTDDEELTVNDLVNIAKEHIEADRHSKIKEASNRESESGSRVAERVYSGNKLEDSVDAQNCIKRSVIPDTRSSKPNGSLTNKEIAFSSSSTGDPAQDMLDLFLGPLLRKTVEKETQTQSLAEDVAFAYEMKTESRSNAVREEIAPVTKKKSSLKDKVAMFLD